MKRDLTQGSIAKHIVSMSVPSMFGLMSQSLYDIVDMIWIGRISVKAVAAVTIFVSIFWLFEVLNEIIGMSSVSLISQSYGAGNNERARRASEQTILFKFAIAVFAAVLMLLLVKPIMNFYSPDQQVRSLGMDYGKIRIYFLPLFFSSYSVNTIFRCSGDARTPMVLLVITSLLNIILDPIFMFDTIPIIGLPGFGMGVKGAAVATVISVSTAFFIGFFLLMSGKAHIKLTWRGLVTFDRELDWKLITIGLPSGAEMFLRNMANSLFLKLIVVYGTAAIAVVGVGSRILGFLFMPILGLLMGSGTITGQNLGAGKIDRAAKTAWYSAWIGIGVVGLLVAVILIFPGQIINLFISDSEFYLEGITMLRLTTPSLIIAAFGLGFATVFSGSGLNLPFLYSCLIARWLIMLPYAWVVVVLLKLPITYVWMSFIIAEIFEAGYMFISFKKGKWKLKRV